MLTEISKIIAGLPYDGAKGARIGGDEFIVVLNSYPSKERLIQLLDHLTKSFERPILIESRHYTVTASIGVACYPAHGIHTSDLLLKADMAMYKAKERGKNQYSIYNAGIQEEIARKALIEHGTRDALAKGDFELYYQPIYDNRTKRVIKIEALLRCRSGELAEIPVIELIETAEKSGLIIPIENWALRHAWTFAARLNRGLDKPVRVTVNISAQHIADPGFIRLVEQVMEETGVQPEWVALEITETAMMESFDVSKRVLERLRAMNIQVLLDDFGTGYSSLNYLKRLPIDTVKIDKSFIDSILVSDQDANITSTIVQLAHNLGMQVVAEGVEQAEQEERLSVFACDMVQGYYYSRPVPAGQIMDLLRLQRQN